MTLQKILFATSDISGIGEKVYDWLKNNNESIVGTMKTKEDLKLMDEVSPDIVLSVGYRHIIPEKYINKIPYGVINFHKAFLPYNRGAYPAAWSIIKNDPTGISMHYMDKGIDTGPIIAQKKINPLPEETAEVFYERLENEQMKMFESYWSRIKNDDVSFKHQKTGSIHTKKDFKNILELKLDKQYTGGDLLNLMKATTFKPYKNLHFIQDGHKYFVDINITKAFKK